MKKKNYELEYEFRKWKDKEDQLLRDLNFPEDKIASLREFDHDLFVNRNRRIQRKEQITSDAFFVATPARNDKEIKTFVDLLDVIENESLFLLLEKNDYQLRQIIMMCYEGYSIKDISKILNIKPNTICKKIQCFKAKYIKK